MKGWKTWAASIGGFCTGITIIVTGIVSDPIDPDKIWQGLVTCFGSLGVVGIGHKIEKNFK